MPIVAVANLRPNYYNKPQKQFEADLTQSFFIGDSWKDMEAAMTVGARPILVETGNGACVLQKKYDLSSIIVCENLFEAANWIITKERA